MEGFNQLLAVDCGKVVVDGENWPANCGIGGF